MIFCLYLGVLARSMLCDAQHFISLIEVVSNETHTKVRNLSSLWGTRGVTSILFNNYYYCIITGQYTTRTIVRYLDREGITV